MFSYEGGLIIIYCEGWLIFVYIKVVNYLFVVIYLWLLFVVISLLLLSFHLFHIRSPGPGEYYDETHSSRRPTKGSLFSDGLCTPAQLHTCTLTLTHRHVQVRTHVPNTHVSITTTCVSQVYHLATGG